MLARAATALMLLLPPAVPGSAAATPTLRVAAATPTLRVVAHGLASAAITGGPATPDVAFLASRSILRVGPLGGTTRDHAVPAGCRPAALTAARVALNCDAGRPPLLLDRATGTITPVAAGAPGEEVSVIALGRRGLLARTSSAPDGVHLQRRLVLLDLASSGTTPLGPTDPFGPHAFPALDGPAPSTKLCPRVERTGFGGRPTDDTRYAIVTRIGRWVLQQGDHATRLQRCGSTHVRHLGRGAGAVLTRERLAYVSGPKIRVVDLRTNSTRDLDWPEGRFTDTSSPVLGWAGNRLIASVQRTVGTYAVYALRP